jgi:GT2 family glycosyltransferase
VPDRFLIERHLKAYKKFPEAVGIAGRVEQPNGDLVEDQIRDVGKFSKITGRVTGNFNSKREWEVDFAPGGNMSFRRTRLLEVGCVDPVFSGNAYFFEPDLGLRVKAKGGRIFFEPLASVVHLMAPRGGARIFDKSEHTYYFIRNGMILSLRHGLEMARIITFFWSIGYAAAKSVYNANPRIFSAGLLGLFHGLKSHFNSAETKIH